jgi:hypothetical protein
MGDAITPSANAALSRGLFGPNANPTAVQRNESTVATSPLDAKVSLWLRAKGTRRDTSPAETIPLRAILERVRDGTYKSAIESVQTIKANGGAQAYRNAKASSLPAFTAAGHFSGRANDRLQEHSGVMVLDFDHVVDLESLRGAVQADSVVVFAFVSPGGDGLKVGIRVPPAANGDTHKKAYSAALRYSSREWGAEASADKQCSDVARLCFVSHDPDAYINEAAECLDVSSSDKLPTQVSERVGFDHGSGKTAESSPKIDREKALEALERLSPTRADDYEAWLEVGMALKAVDDGLHPEWLQWSQQSQKYKPGECEAKWRSFQRNGLGLGSLIRWAREDSNDTDFLRGKTHKAIRRDARDRRPELRVRDDDLTVLLREAWSAISKYNSTARVFNFGGMVADISRRADGEPVIRSLSVPAMTELLARVAFWFRFQMEPRAEPGTASHRKAPTKPPVDIARVMLATPSPELPALQRIARAPMFTPAGKIWAESGYNPDTRCWFALDGLNIRPVSKQPAANDVVLARELLLDDLLGDFPFDGEADRANTLALFLLPFVRELIAGPTPLHLIEKPKAGTGASLLAECLGLLARGTHAPFMTEGSDDEEWRKRITSTLLTSPELVVIDNLRHTLDSGALSSALTSLVWSDRRLGASENVILPVRCVWVATGNNPSTSGEIARRIVPIRLDARTDRPDERSGFRHPKLLSWVHVNRPALIHAALTLAQAWLVAGRPEGRESLASYEPWAATIGGILEVAGVKGFMANRRAFRSRADVEGEQIKALVEAWYLRHGNSPVLVASLLDLATEFDFGPSDRQGRTIKLGKMIAKLVDNVFTLDTHLQVKVDAAGLRNGSSLYRLSTGDPGNSGNVDPC